MIFFSEFSSLTNLIYLPLSIYILRTLISLYNLILKRIRRNNASLSYPQKFNFIANLSRRKKLISSLTKTHLQILRLAPFLTPIIFFFFRFYRIRENEKKKKKTARKSDWRKKDSTTTLETPCNKPCTTCTQSLFRRSRVYRCNGVHTHAMHAGAAT